MKRSIRLITLAVALLIILCATLYGCVSVPDYETLNSRRDEITANNATLQKGQIVMVGDSIVWLYYKYPNAFDGLPLKVYNSGISGDVSDHMLERLDDNVLNLQPKAVSILIGTNDIAHGYKQSDSIANIRKAVEKCQAAGAIVFVQSIYPVTKHANNTTRRKNTRIMAYNENIRALCEECGATYIDMYSVLKGEDGTLKKELTYDGLHPNDEGYAVISKVLKQYFASVV